MGGGPNGQQSIDLSPARPDAGHCRRAARWLLPSAASKSTGRARSSSTQASFRHKKGLTATTAVGSTNATKCSRNWNTSAPKIKLPPYVQHYIDASGKARFYFRRAGFKRVPLPGLPGHRNSWQRMNGRLMSETRVELGALRMKPGNIDAAVVAYFKSVDFNDGLAWKARATGGGRLPSRTLGRNSASCASALSSAATCRHMSQACRPLEPSATWARCSRTSSKYCADAGLIDETPAENVKRAKLISTPIYTWSEDDVVKYEKRHPIGTKARVSLALATQTCVSASLTWCGSGRLHPRRRTARLPAAKDQSRERQKDHGAAAAGHEGNHRRDPGDRHQDLSGHRVRQAVHGEGVRQQDAAVVRRGRATGLHKPRLAQAWPDRLAYVVPDVLRLASISGHKNLKELQLYVEEANRTKLARETMAALAKAQHAAREGARRV